LRDLHDPFEAVDGLDGLSPLGDLEAFAASHGLPRLVLDGEALVQVTQQQVLRVIVLMHERLEVMLRGAASLEHP